MNFYGAHFEYAGRSSEEYGLIVASINESQNMAVSGSGAELITLFNKRDDRRYYIDTNFDGAHMEYDMEIFSEDPISVSDQRAITKWLFYQRGFKKLYVTVADDCDGESQRQIDGSTKRIYLNCILTDPEKIEGGDGIHGYKFHVNCDSPVGWMETVTKTFDIGGTSDDSSKIISVTTDTDLHEYVYPIVQINMAGTAATGNNPNILRGTADMNEGTGGWSTGDWRKSRYDYSDGSIDWNVYIADSPLLSVTRGVLLTYGAGLLGIAQDRTPLNAGTVTLSGYVKATAGVTIRMQTHWFSGATDEEMSEEFTATGDWQYLTMTKTVPETKTYSAGYFYIKNASEGDTMYVVAPKLEYGSVATPWAAASEDPMSGGMNAMIINNTDSNARITSFRHLLDGATFRMNGNTNFITSGFYTKFYDKNFVRLLDGVNNIAVYGPVDSITFEWENRSYV